MGDDFLTANGITYIHIDGEYHIIVKLQKTGTVIEDFDWDAKKCTDGWGYQIIGEPY